MLWKWGSYQKKEASPGLRGAALSRARWEVEALGDRRGGGGVVGHVGQTDS